MQANLDTYLAAKLYNLRRDGGYIQKEVAAGISVSPQIYSLLEKGEYHFTDEIIDSVCIFFKLTRNTFVDSSEKINCYNSPNTAINNTNSQINTGKIIEEFIEEIKSNREERKIFMDLIKTEREQFLKFFDDNSSK